MVTFFLQIGFYKTCAIMNRFFEKVAKKDFVLIVIEKVEKTFKPQKASCFFCDAGDLRQAFKGFDWRVFAKSITSLLPVIQ